MSILGNDTGLFLMGFQLRTLESNGTIAIIELFDERIVVHGNGDGSDDAATLYDDSTQWISLASRRHGGTESLA